MSRSLNPSIFREYDIRGLVGRDLTAESVRAVGLAYGSFLRERGIKESIVGRDNRLSSFAYSRILRDALNSTGVDVVDVGMVTTPVFYFSRIKYGVQGGMMVTGSHNAPEYNGFKLAYGTDTLYGDGIQEIRRIAEVGRFARGSGHYLYEDPIPSYVEDLAYRVRLGPKRVFAVVDAGNGSSGLIARRVLERLGAQFEEMYFEPDGTFPNHHPDPTQPSEMEDLIDRVLRSGADLGIAFDGDADRIGVVDASGRLVFGDELQAVFWQEIMPKYPGTLALIEVKCSQALVDVVRELGGRPQFTRTGHSLIKARMRETGALFTGEMSGHMFFRDEYYGFDDAIYAAARLLRLLSNSSESLSEKISRIPQYHSTPELRISCPDETKFAIVEDATRKFAQNYEVITVDGVRVLFPDGWGLLRASNTQPALVLRAEAKTVQGLSQIKKAIEDVLGGYSVIGTIEWD
ncbi:MAG: phosphomannomutase/phosphoglucomutase [Bacillota bacterium]